MINPDINKAAYHLPFTLSFIEKCDFQVNWHNYIELIYCIKGQVDLKVNDTNHTLLQDEFFLLNKYDIHEMVSMVDNTLLLVIRFDPDFYSKYHPPLIDVRFDNHPSHSSDALNILDDMKALISKLIITWHEQGDTSQLTLVSTSIDILDKVIQCFRSESSTENLPGMGSRDRLARLIEYIDLHSSESISLTELADREFVTPHYLSKFFKKNMGMNFSAYLSQIRLHKSMPTLMGSSESILNIALTYGFPNAKSYSQAFKSHYDMTPHAFRMIHKSSKSEDQETELNISEDNEQTLHKFIEKYQRFDAYTIRNKVVRKSIDLRRTLPQPVRFNKVIYFDFVYDGLNSNWQNNLIQAQQALGFEFIKFKGIFTSGMYYFDPENNWYNWFNVDNLLDFFIQHKLKPFIELTFKPSHHSLSEWHALLESFLSHCLERYGAEALSSWNFEIASEDKSYDSAILLYTKTLRVIKKKFTDLRLGILFIPAADFEEREYLINFRDKDLRFMSVQIDENTYSRKTALCHELLYNIRIGMGLETYVMFDHAKNYWNDTCYMSTETIRETLDNHTVDSLVPFMDNIRSKMMFQGNHALLTYNGLQKPVFNASLLLNKLNGKLVDKGDHHFIVKKNNGDYALLVFNHISVQTEEQRTEPSGHMKYLQEIQKHQHEHSIHISYKLTLDSGSYEKRVYSLSMDNGSIFDAWIHMGAPEMLDRDDLSILRAKEKMHLHISKLSVQEFFSLDMHIRPGEIKLIELKLV